MASWFVLNEKHRPCSQGLISNPLNLFRVRHLRHADAIETVRVVRPGRIAEIDLASDNPGGCQPLPRPMGQVGGGFHSDGNGPRTLDGEAEAAGPDAKVGTGGLRRGIPQISALPSQAKSPTVPARQVVAHRTTVAKTRRIHSGSVTTEKYGIESGAGVECPLPDAGNTFANDHFG